MIDFQKERLFCRFASLAIPAARLFDLLGRLFEEVRLR